ncbi:MAG: MBG domain-containing protein [Candidatus Coproplasma sp.]
MHKKLLILFSVCALALFTSALIACDQGNREEKINGVTFSDVTVTYDGLEHSITVSGVVPDGVTVSYDSASAVNAGVYNATATLSGVGYATKTLQATLTIEKAELSGITFEDKTVTWDGDEHSVLISGNVPSGVSVSYTDNTGSDVGTYSATATLTGANYIPLTLEATLTITRPSNTVMAKTIVNNLLERPDPWSFMPESFAPVNIALNDALPDFSDFTAVSEIPVCGMGKQMNVLYSTLNGASTVLKYLNGLYGVLDTIIEAYQTFINKNPDNYQQFSKTGENYTVSITVTEDGYSLLASYQSAEISITYNENTGLRTGLVKLTNANLVKYEMSENYIKIAASVTGYALAQIEFIKEDDATLGYLYEFVGTDSFSVIKTSAIIYVEEKYTTIISNKRESDDLIIEGYAEVYDSATGQLIASEVKETVKTVDYDTMWFHLKDVNGITTIKKVDQTNDLNADTIYVNGSANPFTPYRNSVLGVKTSRRFDIEMKTLYYYVYDFENEKYEKVEAEIPMMFVQRENLNTFSADAYEKNKNNGIPQSVEISVASSIISDVNKRYDMLLPTFNEIKELVTPEEVKAYLGIKSEEN